MTPADAGTLRSILAARRLVLIGQAIALIVTAALGWGYGTSGLLIGVALVWTIGKIRPTIPDSAYRAAKDELRRR